MAWSWSHTQEGYDNARAQLEALDRETLIGIYAEWKASPEGYFHPRAFSHSFDHRRYERALSAARHMDGERLADRIWEWMERLATCTNGGWEAWCCPHGCCSHMVPFDPLSEDAD